jgi:small-conductance mechanosensitive channel
MFAIEAVSDFLGQKVAMNRTLQQWLVAVAATIIIAIALRLIRRIVAHHVAALAAKRPSDWLDAAGDLVRQTKGWFLLVLALCGGAAALLHPHYPKVLLTAVIVAIVLQGALWGDAIVRSYLTRQVRRRAETDASGATTLVALSYVARLAVWTIAVLLVLANLGVDVTAMVAGLGIGGVAVALAIQNILGDLFASASIVLDKPFVLGDFIVVGDDMGTVEHIGLKTTRVRSLSGEQLVFANNDLLKSRIRNFKRMQERRVVFSVNVAYELSVEKLAAIPAMLREAVEAQASTRFERAHFKRYGDFALMYEVVYYVLSADYTLAMDIQQAINLAIFHRFAQEQISFAHPTQTAPMRQ